MPQGDIFIYDCFTGKSNFHGYFDPKDPDRATILHQNSLSGIIVKKEKYNIPLSDAETEFRKNGSTNWSLLENDPDRKIFYNSCDELRSAHIKRLELLESKPRDCLTAPEKVFMQTHRDRQICFDDTAYKMLRFWREGCCAKKMWQFWDQNSGNAVDIIKLHPVTHFHLPPHRELMERDNIHGSISTSISIKATLNGIVLQSLWIDFTEMDCLLFSHCECAPFFFGETTDEPPLFQVRSRREEDFIILTFFEPLPTEETDIPFKSEWRFRYKDLLYEVRSILSDLEENEEDFPPGVPVQTDARETLAYKIENEIIKNRSH